mgnify:CR=1 FL=1
MKTPEIKTQYQLNFKWVKAEGFYLFIQYHLQPYHLQPYHLQPYHLQLFVILYCPIEQLVLQNMFKHLQLA